MRRSETLKNCDIICVRYNNINDINVSYPKHIYNLISKYSIIYLVYNQNKSQF